MCDCQKQAVKLMLKIIKLIYLGSIQSNHSNTTKTRVETISIYMVINAEIYDKNCWICQNQINQLICL